MRILHVSSWFQPQLGYSEFHLPTAQQRLGHTVAVLTSDRYFPFPDYEATVQPILGRRVVGRGRRVEYGLLTYRLPVAFEYRHHLWLRGFEAAVRDFRPDVVHVYQAFALPTVQAALAKRRHRFRLVVSSSMEPEVFYPQLLLRRVFYWLYARLAAPLLRRRVDAFTAVGPGAREIVATTLGLAPERVAVAPLGADAERFQFDASARLEVRRDLGVGNDVSLVIYAGKLIPRKDVHVLIQAVGRLEGCASVAVLLVGHGRPDYEARLRDIARTTRSRVFFRAAVPNATLPRLFSAADIGAWPSESSNAALEAALVGLPLVVSASPATRHYVGEDNGLTFQRGDPAGLARCLERLANAPALRLQMGQRGREYVREHLSCQAAAERALRLYEERDGAPDTAQAHLAGRARR